MRRWVLLRGLVREARHWGQFPALLQRQWPDEILTPDLPGNGMRYRESSPTRISEMLESLRSNLRQEGHTPPYCIIALSLGAMIATEWANRYPTEITALIMINTSMRPYSPFYHRLRPRNYLALLGALGRRKLAQREQLIWRLTVAMHPDETATVARWIAYQTDRPVSSSNALRQLLAAARFRAAPFAPRVPALVLASRHDQLVNSACSLALANHWGLSVQFHERAGHDLPCDDPTWVIARIDEWMRSPDFGHQTVIMDQHRRSQTGS